MGRERQGTSVLYCPCGGRPLVRRARPSDYAGNELQPRREARYLHQTRRQIRPCPQHLGDADILHPIEARHHDRDRDQRPAPALQYRSVVQSPRHSQPPERQCSRHRVERRIDGIKNELAAKVIGAALLAGSGEKGPRFLITVAQRPDVEWAAPPAKACRCASVPKNITAHNAPLPARSTTTSHPEGNRAAFSMVIGESLRALWGTRQLRSTRQVHRCGWRE